MDFTGLDPVRLRSIVPLRRPKKSKRADPSAEEITNLSKDTLKRNFPSKIRKLSDRREGMQLGDALAIASGITLDSKTT
jgi:hypothetical protein